MEEDRKRVQEGLVKQYNNYYGIIVNNVGEEYDFLNRDVEDKDIKQGDQVMFWAENHNLDNVDFHVARYVRKKSK